MAVTVRHATLTAVADDPAYDVGADEWNAYHTVTPPASDTSDDLITKNVDADNALNGNFRLAAHSYDVNPISGRWDQVYRLGYNMGEAGTGHLVGEPSMGLHWESFYEQGGGELLEFHLAYFTSAGVEYRWESWSHDRNANTIDKSTIFTEWSIFNTGSTNLMKFDAAAVAGSMTIDFNGASSVFRVGTNNIPGFSQKNAAANAYVSLPYIDAGDVLKVSSPVYINANRAGASATYPGCFFTIAAATSNSGDTMIYIPGVAVTGSQYAIQAVGSATTDYVSALYNNNNTATANAMVDLRTIGSGAGDPFIRFNVNGAGIFSAGLDNSDSDKFKISAGAGLGTSDAMVMDASGNVAFSGNITATNTTDGQGIGLKSLTELLTIAAAATSTTTIQKPAHAIILGVSVRVTTAVTCTSTFTVGDSTSAARFSTAAVSKALNSTDKGTKAGAYYNATAEGIVITPDTVPSDATGRVRVTIHYLEVTPPTS